MGHQGVSEDVSAPEHLAVSGAGAEAHPEAGVGCSFREPVLSLSSPYPAQRPLSPQVLPGWHSPLALQEEHHVIDSHSVTDKVCAQQARLCVADAEGLETLAQLVGHSD